MKEQPPSMTLRADFDIEQIGEGLVWHFSRADHEGNPIEGPDAGSIYFTVGEKFHVHVSGGGKTKHEGKKPFNGFRILDCCMISRPQLAQYAAGMKTLYSPPSPFISAKGEKLNATIALDTKKFKDKGRKHPDKPGYYKETQVWEDHLTVGEVAGRWELSFVMTVAIALPDGDEDVRVVTFDPEGTVGTGMNPP